MLNSIVFAAGGTGGHIFPAVAVADELTKLNKDIQINFIGATGKMEEKVIPEAGYYINTVKISGFKRKLTLKNLQVLTQLRSAAKAAGIYLKDYKPDIVFATGGYVSAPVVMAASKLKIPYILYEGNHYPGITVKYFAKKANLVMINFRDSREYIKNDSVKVMPYPVRENLKRYDKSEAVRHFGLDPAKKTLFVFGGSQGARSINHALMKFAPPLASNGIQVIWQTGKPDFKVISGLVEVQGIKIFEFIRDMDYAYSASDLVVCRSGISSVMEVAHFGIPVIFVPYPLAAENHQMKNAQAIVSMKAAEMVVDSQLSTALETRILKLINDTETLSMLSENISRFAVKGAAEKIARFLMNKYGKK